MGPPPRSFAADAHDCIMVRILEDPPNTRLWRDDRHRWQAPLRSSRPEQPSVKSWNTKEYDTDNQCLTSKAPYKGSRRKLCFFERNPSPGPHRLRRFGPPFV